jgi:hypothetical protein
MNQFVGYSNIIPLLAPVDITSTVTATAYMDLKHANRAAFLISLGNIASGSATDRERITVEAATAPAGTEAAIAFKYRMSGVVGANTWGAITAVSATSYIEIALNDDGKLIWIEIDPEVLAANDYRYVRVKATDATDMDNFIIGVVGLVDQKYRQTTYASATAAASA